MQYKVTIKDPDFKEFTSLFEAPDEETAIENALKYYAEGLGTTPDKLEWVDIETYRPDREPSDYSGPTWREEQERMHYVQRWLK